MSTLFIQIPSYNESETLGETINDLPRLLPGISHIFVLVVDDGSTDNTVNVALYNGADYVVRHRQNRGLAHAFMTGINTALALGADIIVNTDADHQYPGKYILELIAPILERKADLVIGDRQPATNVHFSPFKRLIQVIGSWAIRIVSRTNAPDAASGFRAYSKYSALRIQVHNSFSYTLETLIQAGRQKMTIFHIPIETNPNLRPSRLHKGVLNFLWRQGGVIIRSYILYQPLKSFLLLGFPFFVSGSFLIFRFLFHYFAGDSGITRHIQSVSIGGTLVIFGVLSFFMGLLGDTIRANRNLLEETLISLRGKQYEVDNEKAYFEINGNPVFSNKMKITKPNGSSVNE